MWPPPRIGESRSPHGPFAVPLFLDAEVGSVLTDTDRGTQNNAPLCLVPDAWITEVASDIAHVKRLQTSDGFAPAITADLVNQNRQPLSDMDSVAATCISEGEVSDLGKRDPSVHSLTLGTN